MTSAPASSSKFFDRIDSIDRYLYGRKMKNFVIGSILVVIVMPLLDELMEVPYDRLTYYTMLFFFFYTLLLILAWVSSLRDENGKWAWKPIQSRLVTYYHILKNTARATKTNSRDEKFYRVASVMIIGAVCWKATQNLSVFVRKPLENIFDDRIDKLRNFESITRHWYGPVLIIGIGIMIYLIRTNPQILSRIKKELRQFFGNRANTWSNPSESLSIKINQDHMEKVLAGSTSQKFNQFIAALQSWKPRNFRYECEYQNSLYEHLEMVLPDSKIDTEYPIADPSRNFKGRIDIVIDETILIEMKRDSSAGAVQRAQGQIQVYSGVWSNRGPVILLLCDHEYEKAKASYAPVMLDLHKLSRPALTIVQAN